MTSHEHSAPTIVETALGPVGVQRAAVFTWSGGGPAGYRLAVRHPERVDALVANAAISHAYRWPGVGLVDHFMFGTRPGRRLLRLLAARAPERYITGALPTVGDLSKQQLAQRVDDILADPAAAQARVVEFLGRAQS